MTEKLPDDSSDESSSDIRDEAGDEATPDAALVLLLQGIKDLVQVIPVE